METNSQAQAPEPQADLETALPHYDRHIIPAETAARQEREGDLFMHLPSKEDDLNAEAGDRVHAEGINTTGGYTVDQEGLLNNYAIEPEMYINEPGDLRQQAEAEAVERAREIRNLNEDETGKLTDEEDLRGKGPGLF